MSFLTIAQTVHNLMRGGNAAPGSKPTVIPVPTSPLEDQMVYDCVTAVQQAWINLQNLHDGWRWMRKQTTLPLVNGTRTYNLALIRASTPRYDWVVTFDVSRGPIYLNLYSSSAVQRVDQPVQFIPYEDWRGWKDRRPLSANAQPRFFTEWPDYTLEFDPTPNIPPLGGNWTVVLDYRQTNQSLVAAADVPECPPRFHDLIAWMAVEIICETRGSTGLLLQLARREIYGEGTRQGRLSQLENSQLPALLIDTRYA